MGIGIAGKSFLNEHIDQIYELWHAHIKDGVEVTVLRSPSITQAFLRGEYSDHNLISPYLRREAIRGIDAFAQTASSSACEKYEIVTKTSPDGKSKTVLLKNDPVDLPLQKKSVNSKYLVNLYIKLLKENSGSLMGPTQCPGKHTLTPHTLKEDGSFFCDVCGRNVSGGRSSAFPKGTEMYGCRTCDWDMCSACKPPSIAKTVAKTAAYAAVAAGVGALGVMSAAEMGYTVPHLGALTDHAASFTSWAWTPWTWAFGGALLLLLGYCFKDKFLGLCTKGSVSEQ